MADINARHGGVKFTTMCAWKQHNAFVDATAD